MKKVGLIKLLVGLTLAASGAFAVGSALSNKAEKEVEVEAATTYWDAGDVIYVRLYSGFFDSNATVYANYPDGGGTWHSEQITTSVTTKGNETLYKYTFSNAAASFQILRKNSSGSDQWGYTDSFTTHSTNLFEVTGYGNGQYMNANYASASVVNVSLVQPSSGGTIAVKNANGSQSGAGYYYSDWSLQFTASPSADYYFVNWTEGDGTDWTGSNKTTNPVTLSGLAGEYSVSCKFDSYNSKTFKILGATSGTWTAQSQNIEISLSYQSGTAATSDGATYYSTSVSLTAGSVFKPVNLSDNVYYDYDSLESGSNSVKGTHIVSDGTGNKNMKVVTTAVYEVYVKTGSGAVWMQLSSQSEAAHYAELFLSNISCTSNSVSFELDAWNKVGNATTSMEYKFEQLTSGARNILSTAQADKDSDDPIKQCAARYDRILAKYGYGTASGQYHDFMGRTPARLNGSANLILPSIGNNNSNTIAIIVIISLVSVTAIGGYFFIKRRQEN